MSRCERIIATHQARLTEQERILAELQAWHSQLQADNQANPDPPPYLEVRMDAGFDSGENLTWLLEMGYSPVTKALNQRVTAALRGRLTGRTPWVRVGENADMTAWGDYRLHGGQHQCPGATRCLQAGSPFQP